ncbi:phage portal protein [Amycolatopsis albispora]|uniref:Portal protein n=1 Tax=Amycolatopsis albispora TaxID=1804986 RepID=A0A344LGX9_9PSEU|nr:phage portal protein [Amycolatopsis albispora]AXB47303.1 hypothetical protein A4R43_36660 [Amycolatopsis albispora]
MSDLDDALNAMKKARPGYDKAKAYSEGPVSETFVSPKLRRLLRAKGNSFITLLGDVVIDGVADKLEITAITGQDDAQTQAVAAVDEANNMALTRPETNRRALQFGDAYLSAWPALDEDGNEVAGQVKVSVWDPRTCRVLYDPENPGVPKLAIFRWEVGKRVRVDLAYADRIEHYISKSDGGRASSANDFVPYTEDGREAEEPNPYGEVPVFHFHGTGLPGEYGTPEHRPFYGTQDKLIKLTVGHMAGVDFNSAPQRVALRELGSNSSEAAELDEDDFAISPDGERTTTKSGEDDLSTLTSGPGTLWDLSGVKDVKEFSTGDPAAFLDPATHYLREGALASKTPLHLFDRTGQIPSGESLKTANEPLDKKTNKRLLSLDGTWRQFYRFVLKLLGHEDATVSISWAPVESTDDTTKLAQAAQRRDVGVPPAQYLRELGYRGEDVDEWLKTGEGDLAARVELLARLGDAVSSMATAVAAGVLDESVVAATVAKVIGDIDGGSDDGGE